MTPNIYSNITELSKDPAYKQTISQILKVWTKSGIDSEADDEDRVALISYNLTYWHKSEIKFVLEFKNPSLISLNTITYQDELHIQFILAWIIIDEVEY